MSTVGDDANCDGNCNGNNASASGSGVSPAIGAIEPYGGGDPDDDDVDPTDGVAVDEIGDGPVDEFGVNPEGEQIVENVVGPDVNVEPVGTDVAESHGESARTVRVDDSSAILRLLSNSASVRIQRLPVAGTSVSVSGEGINLSSRSANPGFSGLSSANILPHSRRSKTNKSLDKEWHFERILGRKTVKGIDCYKIQWSKSYNTKTKRHDYWEPTYEPVMSFRNQSEKTLRLAESFDSGTQDAYLSSIGASSSRINVVEVSVSRSSGPFGLAVTNLIDTFKANNMYSRESGLGGRDTVDANIDVQIKFFEELFDAWKDLHSTYATPLLRVTGRIDHLEKNFRKRQANAKRELPFYGKSSTAAKVIRSLVRSDKLVVFFVVQVAMVTIKTPLHCGVGIVEETKPRNVYFYDTNVDPEGIEYPSNMFVEIATALSKTTKPKIGYGGQTESLDCVERASHFMATVLDGGDWRSLAPYGFNDYNKPH